jgi:osmotically inducible lipoprotein OsmB
MTMRKLFVTGLLCSTLALSACGTSPTERALSGGAIGAGTGAVISGATGGSPWTGAAIGGAAGAIGGAATAD